MARGITGTLRNVFGADHFIPRFKVEIESPDGIYVDVATLLGEDYFDGVRLETDIDNPTVTGTLWLRRDIAGKSLSPLMGSSAANRNASNAYVPFLKAARYIRISISAKLPGDPEPTEWVRVINDGKIDRVKFAKDPIEVSFSDKTKWLTHKYIEDETAKYSSDSSPIALETALQQVLTANPAPRIGVATFATPVSPAWNVGGFTPTGNLLEAIRAVTLSIGWEWRERWSSLTANEFRLYAPNRAASVADWTFGPAEYFEIRDLESNDDDIRNRITVNYVGLDGKPASVTVNDSASQTEYGVRFMGISKDKTASVRTSGQATALGNNALSDLAQPGAEHEIRTSIAPFVELGDMLAHLSDNLAYDSTQTYAVVGLTHEFRNGHGESTFRTRGKPAAAWRRWLEIGDDAETPLPPNSTLDVYATQFDTTYSIAWSGNGATTLSIDGGAYATPPSSPIVVTRNPEGGATKVYRFRTVLGDDITYETIYVLPIGADTVTPDIDVVPSAPATLTQAYTVNASNPKSGGVAPTVTVFSVGCGGTVALAGGGSATVVDGAAAITIPTGSVVTMTRPAFGSGAGSVIFSALISGGGRAEIQRTVTPRQSTGPNLTVTPTPFASTYSIAWSGDSVSLSIDGGAFVDAPASPLNASPIIVNRPAIGQPDKVYTFRGYLDGQTVTNTITVPAIGSPESPNLSVAQGTETDTTIAYTVTAAAPGGGTAPSIQVYLTDCTASVADGATITSGTVVTANRPAFANKRDGSIRFRAAIGTSYEEIVRTVSAQVQTSFGPSLTVTPSPFDTTYSLYFAGDSVQVDKRDGNGFVAPGASPLVVTRPSQGSADLVYTFRATKDGQEVTNSVTIPARGAADSPNLNVTPQTPSSTQQAFVVTASSESGTTTPSIAVYLTGTASFASAHYSGGPVASGDTVTINKPPFGDQAASVRFRATLGSAYEEISRTIVTQIKTSFGPTFDFALNETYDYVSVTFNAPGATVEASVDNGAHFGVTSPYTIYRNEAGGNVKQITFYATKDGQMIANTISVPPKSIPIQPGLKSGSSAAHYNDPNAGDQSNDAAWTTQGAISDGTHTVAIDWYKDGVLWGSNTGVAPSAGSSRRTVAGSPAPGSSKWHAVITLSGGGITSTLTSRALISTT